MEKKSKLYYFRRIPPTFNLFLFQTLPCFSSPPPT